jgi:bifunctional non-homologous end joining protein LigD
VTKRPSLIPGDKRHPSRIINQYNTFEGIMPDNQYGGGTVMIWDRGSWTPEHDPHKGMKKGHLDFELHGDKLRGRWHLVRMRKRPGERQEPWLLIKATDEFARKKSDPDILEEMPDSAATGRAMDEIAAQVWHSNRSADDQLEAKRAKAAPNHQSGEAPRLKKLANAGA